MSHACSAPSSLYASTEQAIAIVFKHQYTVANFALPRDVPRISLCRLRSRVSMLHEAPLQYCGLSSSVITFFIHPAVALDFQAATIAHVCVRASAYEASFITTTITIQAQHNQLQALQRFGNRRRQRPAWGAAHCWQQSVRAAIFGLLLYSRLCQGQQPSATAAKFAEELAAREAELTQDLEDGKFVSAKFHPEHSYASTSNYTFAFPRASDYSIGLLVDPCKGNKYDCCVRAYGAPEYPMLLDADTTRERVVPKLVHAPPGQILSKVNIIDQDGIAISAMNSRFADDEVVVDSACLQNNVPYTACVDFMQRQQRSRLVPPCMDNNET
eukprot:8832-Heterococcus_DN1.PRE.1